MERRSLLLSSFPTGAHRNDLLGDDQAASQGHALMLKTRGGNKSTLRLIKDAESIPRPTRRDWRRAERRRRIEPLSPAERGQRVRGGFVWRALPSVKRESESGEGRGGGGVWVVGVSHLLA